MAVLHHTKNKGDLGVAKACADLIEQGYLVLYPMTEHAPFDLVTYRDGRFARVQVKYRRASNSTVTVHFRGIWSDKQGVHVQPMDKGSIDALCIYCPDTDECYYVAPGSHGQSVTLRLRPARNGQSVGVLLAETFRSLDAALGSPADGLARSAL